MSEVETIGHMRNNCTLVAVREIVDLPEAEIFTAFRKNGYRNNEGMRNAQWIQAAKDLGLELNEIDTRKKNGCYGAANRMLLAEFVRTFPKGNFFVSTDTHAFVVREGKVVDHNLKWKLGMRRRIWNAFKILNAPIKIQEKKKGITVKISAFAGKRYGTASYERYSSMVDYLAINLTGSPEDVFKNTKYTRADFNFDIKKGLIQWEK